MIGFNPVPQGDLYRLNILDPAPGTNFTHTWAPGFQYLTLAVVYVLTAAGAGPNRNPGLRFGWNGVNFDYKFVHNQAGGLVIVYYWFTNASFPEVFAVDGVQMKLPYPLIFNAGETLGCVINGIQAGDQVSDIDVRVMRKPLTQ